MFCDRMGTKQTKGELLLGEYMRAKEAAKKWGVTQDLVARWCRAGKIDGAEQDAKEVRGGYQQTQRNRGWQEENKQQKRRIRRNEKTDSIVTCAYYGIVFERLWRWRTENRINN